MDTSHGYNVALWRDGEIVYELVTDLDERDIRALLDAQDARAISACPGDAALCPANHRREARLATALKQHAS